MALRNRIIEIAYRLKDAFTGKITQITGGMRSIERASSRSADTIEASNRRASRSFRGFTSATLAAKGALVALGYAAVRVAKAVLGINREFDATQRGFEAVAGDAQDAAKEMEFVRQTADEMGASFSDASKAYLGLFAASKGTSLEGQQTRDIFLAVSRAMGRLGRSAEQTRGALRAIEQMMSKGNVQAEELRGQLGERLPQAFPLAAKAMNVTTAELNDMLERGEVLASELLPKLTIELNKLYNTGEEISGFNAEWNRLLNVFYETAKAGGEAGGSFKKLTGAIKDLASGLKSQSANIKTTLQAIAGGFTAAAGVIRVAWNGLTAVFGSVAAGLSKSMVLILRSFALVTTGDLSSKYNRWADEMQGITEALKKGVVDDVREIGTAFESIGQSFDFDTGEDELKKQSDSQRRHLRDKKSLEALARNEEAQAREAAKASVEKETETLKEQLKERSRAYQQHLRDMRKYQDDQKDINKEFSQLAQDLYSDAQAIENPDLGDIQDLRATARKQLSAGEFDEAIKSARQAGELLKEMKEQGTESNLVLSGTAKLIQQVAVEAARGKAERQVIDTEKEKKGVADLKKEIEELKKVAGKDVIKLAAELDTEKALAAQGDLITSMQEKAKENPIIWEIKFQGAPGFSDGTGFVKGLEEEAMKRGYK